MALTIPTLLIAQQTAATAKPAIENLHPLTPQLLSGGQPKDDAAFSKLAEMGVKTIVSVDGAKPDLAAAKKHGLRYVHIPIGYDGVDGEAQAALTRLMREAQGPIFVHCHHGKHRGPAAAAVACMAAGDMTREQAAEFMKLAGTGKEYAGLWRDVAAFKPLPANAKLPPLIETAQVDTLAAAMADLDRAWDGMKLCQAAGWKTPANHADLAPAHQSLLAWEGLAESRRMAENADPQMVQWLDEAVAEAAQLRQSIQAGDERGATRQFKRVEAACARCHEQYRNGGELSPELNCRMNWFVREPRLSGASCDNHCHHLILTIEHTSKAPFHHDLPRQARIAPRSDRRYVRHRFAARGEAE